MGNQKAGWVERFMTEIHLVYTKRLGFETYLCRWV